MFFEMAFDELSGVLLTFEKYWERPEAFNPEQGAATRDVFKSMTKTFSDLVEQSCCDEIEYRNLPPLVVENFDDEQVWQQLELRNTLCTPYFAKYLKTFDGFTFDVKSSINQSQNDSRTAATDLSSVENSAYAFDGPDNEENDSESEFSAKCSEPPRSQKMSKRHSSAVDDRFFKLSQMEEFLKYSDLQEERGQLEQDSGESDIDLFADIPSGDESVGDDTDENAFESGDDQDEDALEKMKRIQEQPTKEIMYKDFFDPPDENESVNEHGFDISDGEERFEIEQRGNRNDASRGKKKVRFGQDIMTDQKLQLLDDSDDDIVQNRSFETDGASSKTAFERQREKELKQIQKLEESLLKEKPWQFTGEVAADKRPQNSLLKHDFEHDSNLKLDFVSTDEITEKVENIIKMAIENKAWCDVEVKMRPVEDVFKHKYTEPLNQAKSDKSLAEVYEEEYKKKHEEEEEKEDPRHVEIRKMMDSVASSLSVLFSHTPRPPVPEIKVVNNMPAIAIEEVAPVGVSDATLLAPEEIKGKSVPPIGKSERTETDKKRERRKKKKLQKIRKLEKEEKEKKRASVSKKGASEYAKQEALKKLSQQKNVTIIRERRHKKKN